jgi:hypothetical protein
MCGKKGGGRVRAAEMDENDFFPGWTLRVEAVAAAAALSLGYVLGSDRHGIG